MMVGMMLPSALPMILLFTMVQRQQGDKPVLMTATFAAGYLLIWGGFALVAAALQTEAANSTAMNTKAAAVAAPLLRLALKTNRRAASPHCDGPGIQQSHRDLS